MLVLWIFFCTCFTLWYSSGMATNHYFRTKRLREQSLLRQSNVPSDVTIKLSFSSSYLYPVRSAIPASEHVPAPFECRQVGHFCRRASLHPSLHPWSHCDVRLQRPLWDSGGLVASTRHKSTTAGRFPELVRKLPLAGVEELVQACSESRPSLSAPRACLLLMSKCCALCQSIVLIRSRSQGVHGWLFRRGD